MSWARSEGILLRLQLMTGDWSLPQTFVGGQRQNAAHPGVNVPGVDLTPAVDWWAANVRLRVALSQIRQTLAKSRPI